MQKLEIQYFSTTINSTINPNTVGIRNPTIRKPVIFPSGFANGRPYENRKTFENRMKMSSFRMVDHHLRSNLFWTIQNPDTSGFRIPTELNQYGTIMLEISLVRECSVFKLISEHLNINHLNTGFIRNFWSRLRAMAQNLVCHGQYLNGTTKHMTFQQLNTRH